MSDSNIIESITGSIEASEKKESSSSQNEISKLSGQTLKTRIIDIKYIILNDFFIKIQEIIVPKESKKYDLFRDNLQENILNDIISNLLSEIKKLKEENEQNKRNKLMNYDNIQKKEKVNSLYKDNKKNKNDINLNIIYQKKNRKQNSFQKIKEEIIPLNYNNYKKITRRNFEGSFSPLNPPLNVIKEKQKNNNNIKNNNKSTFQLISHNLNNINVIFNEEKFRKRAVSYERKMPKKIKIKIIKKYS